MSERYVPKGIIKQSSDTVKHFTPENGLRDLFGNRFISSKDLSYLDREGDTVKAGVLISKEGQSFIAKNPGILKDIDKGLAILDPAGNGVMKGEDVDLGNGATLSWQTMGSQSHFFVLTTKNGERYAIKTHVRKHDIPVLDIDQPYINEMLQTQAIALDLKNKFLRLKVKFPAFLFASGQVLCTSFEEDFKNYEPLKDEEKIRDLKALVLEYLIDKSLIKDPLWKNIVLDLPSDRITLSMTLLNNFRTKPDGTIVWIDPFFYNKS